MIKNLLFDLGGVIMEIRRENCVSAMKTLGMYNADEYLGEYSQKGPFAKIENGEWSAGEFHDGIREIVGRYVSDEAIDSAFEEFLVGIPVRRLDELVELRKKYKVYMLSNTNPIMWESKIRIELEKLGKDENYYFDGCVKSYEAKCMKPSREIFEIVCSRLGIKPEETVFFDDSKRNCQAAAELGFHTIWVQPGDEFMKLLTQSGLAE